MGTAAPLTSQPFAHNLLSLVLFVSVLLPLMMFLVRQVLTRIWFMRRFMRPPLAIQEGDRVVTALGFEAEVVSVSAQVVELRLDAGDGKTVISVFRGDILARIPGESGRT